MRSQLLAFLLLLTTILASAQAGHDTPRHEKLNVPEGFTTRVLALESAWSQAEKMGDTRGIEPLLDDSLVYVRYDGTLWTKSQYLASRKDPASHEDQAVNEDMVALDLGSTVIVTGIYRVKGVEKGKPYTRKQRFLDIWNHRDGVWKCVASQVTLISH